MRLLLVHPGASWSTADVEAGLRYGLQAHGVDVVRYRLDVRLERSKSWLYASWRKAIKTNPEVPRPTVSDWIYQAGIGALEMALRHQVDVVVAVSGMVLHPDVLTLMRRAGLRVTLLCTETPYDLEQELRMAALVDGVWTNERSSVEAFRAVCPRAGYLPHAWHPERHGPRDPETERDLRAHDVVFVGSGFAERIAWFNAIDWTGIDLGLYGTWKGLGLKKQVRACVYADQLDNRLTAALYRRAKVGLNLYRTSKGFGRKVARITHAESLSPRAYELAACGAFHLSEYRAEVSEMFGDLVPTFQSPTEAAALIRRWVSDDAGRAVVAAQLPACVAESSWRERARQVIGDLQALLASPQAMRRSA